MANIDIRESVKRMLKTEVMTGGRNVVVDGDDYQSREKVEVGDVVYLNCAFYDDGRGHVWAVKGQTLKKGLITGAPTPSDGANAVVQCDVVSREASDKVQLDNPEIIEFNMNDSTAKKLEERI